MTTQTKLIDSICEGVKRNGFSEISFTLFRKVFRIESEEEINPACTKLARKRNFQFNINWNFQIIAFRQRGRKVGLAA